MKRQDAPTLTPAGKQKLEKELVDLRGVRPDALVNLQRARAMGDLKENGAYQAAREHLTNLDRRIIKLELLLRTAVVVEKTNEEIVQLGSTVEVDGAQGRFIYHIVGDAEMNLKEKKISLNSPLGKALMNHVKNDTVELFTPSGVVIYKIISIL